VPQRGGVGCEDEKAVPVRPLRVGSGLSPTGQEQTVKRGSAKMKKTQRQLVKDAFTKSRDEIYAEMSKSEKLGYWISIFVVVTIMFLIWNWA
jgi:hypothetical protein